MDSRQDRMVLIIGAGGVLGGIVADVFESGGWEVLRGRRTPIDDGSVRHLDLDRPETVTDAIDEMPVVVTTVPDPGFAAHRACLASGALLLDLSAAPAAPGIAFAASASGPGLVILNAGMAPGVTNLVADALLDEHPEADEVELVLTLSRGGVHGTASGDFAHRGLTARPVHETIQLRLPEPWGEIVALGFAEAEDGWLGAVRGGRRVRTFIAYDDPAMQQGLLALNANGGFGRLPRAGLGKPVPVGPGGPPHEPVAHRIALSRDGERLVAATVRCEGDFLSAGHVARILAEARPDRSGAMSIEQAYRLFDLRRPLRRAGITIAGGDRSAPLEQPVEIGR